MKVTLYAQDGSNKGEIAVPESIFGFKAAKGLIHKVLMVQQGNRRHPIAHTLTKGEVRGGGKKPYKQKHTGNARQGSITNPHYRGGGVALGPRSDRNYKRLLNKKERRSALFGTLSAKLEDGCVSALESFESAAPKTKEFATMLKKLPFQKTILFVLPGKNQLVTRSARNIPHVKTTAVSYLSLEDLLKYRDIVFFKEALPKLEEIYVKL